MRRSLPLIGLIILLLPVAELAILIALGRRFGVQVPLLIVAGSVVAGVLLLQKERDRLLRLRSGGMTAMQPLDMTRSLALTFAGILLIIPGVLTDIAALLLMFPLTRALLGLALIRSIQNRFSRFTRNGAQGFDNTGSGAGTGPFPGFETYVFQSDFKPESADAPNPRDSATIIDAEFTRKPAEDKPITRLPYHDAPPPGE